MEATKGWNKVIKASAKHEEMHLTVLYIPSIKRSWVFSIRTADGEIMRNNGAQMVYAVETEQEATALALSFQEAFAMLDAA